MKCYETAWWCAHRHDESFVFSKYKPNSSRSACMSNSLHWLPGIVNKIANKYLFEMQDFPVRIEGAFIALQGDQKNGAASAAIQPGLKQANSSPDIVTDFAVCFSEFLNALRRYQQPLVTPKDCRLARMHPSKYREMKIVRLSFYYVPGQYYWCIVLCLSLWCIISCLSLPCKT